MIVPERDTGMREPSGKVTTVLEIILVLENRVKSEKTWQLASVSITQD